MKTIKVKEIIGTHLATSEERAKQVIDAINLELQSEPQVELDFSGVTIMVSNFAHPLIGKLLEQYDFNKEVIKSKIRMTGLSNIQISLLETCRDVTMKKFHDGEIVRK